MNYKPKKYEIEILKVLASGDVKIKKDLEAIFGDAIKEIEDKIKDLEAEGTTSKMYQAEFQKTLLSDIKQSLDTLSIRERSTIQNYLEDTYKTGYSGAFYSLNKQGVPYIQGVRADRIVKAINGTVLNKTVQKTLAEDAAKMAKPIRREIVKGIATGLRYNEIGQNIANNCTNITKNRAITIARTEGHRVANYASFEATKDASKVVNIKKQWCATLDERTRESHMMLDGELRDIDETFSNGLMYPGDPKGSAGEVINCRCTLLERPTSFLSSSDLKEWEVRGETLGVKDCKDFREYKELLSNLSADD